MREKPHNIVEATLSGPIARVCRGKMGFREMLGMIARMYVVFEDSRSG